MQTVFILSHNSPNTCITLDTLIKLGYAGKWYIIIDDEDEHIVEYKTKYGHNLIIYNKEYFIRTCDSGFETSKSPGCTLVARCAVEELSKLLNLDSFIVLDDDITDFKFVALHHDEKCLSTHNIPNITEVFDLTVDYMLSNNIACLSYCTQNWFMGGYASVTSDTFFDKRTISNCLIRNTKYRNGQFMCMYEDWCYSLNDNKIGNLVFSLPLVKLLVKPQHTQSNNKQSNIEGNADLYRIKDYERNFLPILAFPNCVTLKTFKNKLTPYMQRDLAYPKIISSKFKK